MTKNHANALIVRVANCRCVAFALHRLVSDSSLLLTKVCLLVLLLHWGRPHLLDFYSIFSLHGANYDFHYFCCFSLSLLGFEIFSPQCYYCQLTFSSWMTFVHLLNFHHHLGLSAFTAKYLARYVLVIPFSLFGLLVRYSMYFVRLCPWWPRSFCGIRLLGLCTGSYSHLATLLPVSMTCLKITYLGLGGKTSALQYDEILHHRFQGSCPQIYHQIHPPSLCPPFKANQDLHSKLAKYFCSSRVPDEYSAKYWWSDHNQARRCP